MKRLLVLLFIFMMTLLAACGGSDVTEPKSPNKEQEIEQSESNEVVDSTFPVTITDATGEQVVIEEEPDRLVTLIPSNTEIVFALGLGDKVVGVTNNDNYPKEVETIEKVGDMDLNIEKIISLEPDLVLTQASALGMSSEGIEQIKNADIPVLVVNEATNFESVYDSIEMIGQAIGATDEAKTLVTNMQNEINEVKAKAEEVTEKKSVIFEVTPAPEIFVGGKNTFMDEILTIINAENKIEEEGWPQLNDEAMVAYNPDIIITTYGFYVDNAVEQVLNRSGWEDVTAIKEEQVYDIHADLVTRPGPRLAEGVKEIAKAVYPEIFNES